MFSRVIHFMAAWLIQRFCDDLERLALQQGNSGHRRAVAIAHARCDHAHGARACIAPDRVFRRLSQGTLRRTHGGALRLRGSEIVATSNCFSFGDPASRVVHDHLGELIAFHRVDRQLELSVSELELTRYGRTAAFARRQALFERCSDALKCSCQRRLIFLALLVLSTSQTCRRHHTYESGSQQCSASAPHSSLLSASPVVVTSASAFCG